MRLLTRKHASAAAPPPGVREAEQEALSAERSQALVRLLVVTAVVILLTAVAWARGHADQAHYHAALAIAGSYWVFSCGWLLWLRRARRVSAARRTFALGADLLCATYTIHVAGPLGAFFYPIYLWIIAGHGVRFGPRYLITGAAISVAGFATVLLATPYWQQNLLIGGGLLMGLLVLPAYFLALMRQLHALNQRLGAELEKSRHAASHDPLTGLANRNQFYARLEQEIERAQRSGSRVAVMFIDLNGFKSINDCLGHHVGDYVLQQVGLRLARVSRQSDLAARLGGDEFAMLVCDVHGSEQTQLPAARIAEAVAQPIDVEGRLIQLSASIGASLYPAHGSTADELTRHADMAMYAMKRKSKSEDMPDSQPAA